MLICCFYSQNHSMKHQKEKDLQLLATRLTEENLIHAMLKNTINHFYKRKTKNR